MSDNETPATSKSSPFPWFGVTLGALTFLFSWAKIMGHIDWSWWLVFAPILPAAAVSALFLGIVALVVVLGIVALPFVGVWYAAVKAAEKRATKRNDVTIRNVKPNKR